MKYRIYPSIGIARVGNSETGMFIGPERPGSPGTEIGPGGSETPVTHHKDGDHKVKRQAARFHLFTADGSPAALPDGAVVEWSVRLTNKKDAIVRSDNPPRYPQPDRPTVEPGREDRVIDTDVQQVAGPDQARVVGGTYRGHPIELGELRTDRAQRLIVLGGRGTAGTFPEPGHPGGAPIGDELGGGDFYNNRGWYDDVSDGPVTATIRLPDGTVEQAAPAWVIVAPPDYAPAVGPLVSLHDVILELALTRGWHAQLPRVRFATDILPWLQRWNALRWVLEEDWPQLPTSGPHLETPGADPAAVAARSAVAKSIRDTDDDFSQGDASFTVPPWLLARFAQWVAGDFDAGPPAADASPDELTRAALSAAVGQPFFPGIEAGHWLLNPTIYAQPFDFRIDHEALGAGDVTARMALPWQADFRKCNTNWWPSQRPDQVPTETGTRSWLRPLPVDHRAMTSRVMQLGVVEPAGDGKQIERGHEGPG